MQRKPIILILTAADEKGEASESLAESIKRIGTHNVVIIDDNRYGAARRGSLLARLISSGADYTGHLSGGQKQNSKPPKKGRPFRIANAVKRYNPELVLCTSPYSYYSAVDSKRRSGFKPTIIYCMPFFALDKQNYEYDGTVYIVENQDVKAALVSRGVPSKRVMTMGLPYEITKISPLELASLKQELGLPRTMTLFLNADLRNGVQELFSLLLDQGSIVNIVVFSEDLKTVAALRAKSDEAKANNVIIVQKQEQFNEYLSASDVIITRFDAPTIYKAFKLGKPVITFGKGEQTEREIGYLVDNGLVMRAKESIDVVALIYRLVETGVAASYIQAAEKWVEMSSLENITNYIVSYLDT